MTLKIVRKGTADQYNDHRRLNYLDEENQHPIKTIIGLLDYLNKLDLEDIRLDSEIKALDLTLSDIVEKIKNGELGGGGSGGNCDCNGGTNATISSLKYTSNLEYEGTKLVKETYVGDVNKVVTYNYDTNDNIALKTVIRPDGEIVNATYEYDEQNNLVKVIDNGVDDIYIAGIGGIASCITKKDVNINFPVLMEIINVNNIITKEKIISILNSEILIHNSSNEISTLIIEQSGIEILNVNLDPGDTQKYILGTSKSIIVKVKGMITYEYTLNGVKDGVSSSGSGGSSIDEEQLNSIINSKLEVINKNITDLQIQNIKAYKKYDKALNLNANYNWDYFVDVNASSFKKEGE